MTLLQMRKRMMKEIIEEMIDNYLWAIDHSNHKITRACATCGKKFHPHNRNHFFHATECRKEFYRGQFMVRKV